MTIQIGEQQLPTSRPGDLDARLIETTGCTAAEHRTMLTKSGTPFQIARALRPFLPVDAPSIGELAEAIGDADTTAVRMDVLALLAPPALTQTAVVVGG